jgi:tetratricopeptide (TPR) repeat protein
MAFNKAKALQEAEKLVSQGKISQAVKQYEHIIEKEPEDLSLLNTVGDLYVRDKKTPEALKHFHKLADAYSQEGFTLKAIAIYKKISKLDANTVEVLVKIGDLYVLQGLAREARDQFAQAVEAFRKKNQNDKALEAFRKIVALDPENVSYRLKLADFCLQVGKKPDAARTFVEAAELALRRGDLAAAEGALTKAASADDKNPQVQLLRARIAVNKNQPAEAEKFLKAAPDLLATPAAQQILLEVYLATKKLDEAEKLVVDVFRANPMDFSPVASYVTLCLSKGDPDAALAPLSKVADILIEIKNPAPLMETLRKIWQENLRHIPTLEMLYKLCDKTADEASIPELLEALGSAYVQKGDLEKAEATYQKLLSREPENANYKAFLQRVLEKQGKAVEARPEDFEEAEVALEPQEGEAAVAAPGAPSAEEAAMVREALENSDLFSRYGLAEKATVELEKVLVVYPDQVDIHRRILEVCQKNLPDRAKQAAEALAKIHATRGETELAEKYSLTARTGAPPPVVEPTVPLEAPPEPAEAPAAEFDLSSGIPGTPPEEAPKPGPQEIPLDLSAMGQPAAEEEPASEAPPAPVQEFDLSAGFEAAAAPPAEAEAPPAEVPFEPAPPPAVEEALAFSFEDSKVEVDFYLSQGFVEEAEKAVAGLEAKFPENAQVQELRRMLEEKVGHLPVPGETIPVAEHEEAQPEPEPAVEEVAAEPPNVEEFELPSAPLSEAAEEAAAGPAIPPAPPEPIPVEAASEEAAEPVPEIQPLPEPVASPAAPMDALSSLVGDLAESLEGIAQEAPPLSAAPPDQTLAASPAGIEASSPLSGLLEELGEEPGAQAAADDPQTHYDLGVAFREMSLYDEAIGEFQKVVKGAQKGKYPPNFLQACTLLATCFMDKQMPAIAAKWYARALETPGLDDEATMSLEYDMGVAFEQAGDKKTALEKFSEVYSQNIDFRDVAEKIRQLQQKS